MEKENYQIKLQRAREELQELKDKGIDRVSDFDFKICYGSDIEMSMRCTFDLLEAHVHYYESKVRGEGNGNLSEWI
jgi:hypothetical protein